MKSRKEGIRLKIGVTYLQSQNADMETRDLRNREYLEQLAQQSGHTLTICNLDELDQYDLPVVFVGGGGTEGDFLKIAPRLPEPIFLITSGENNSLAASMEILSFLKKEGIQGEILHGDFERMSVRLDQLARIFRLRHEMQGMKLGCVGEPSDWLISSQVDDVRMKKQTGIEIVRISMNELFEEIGRHTYEENEYTKMARLHPWPEPELEKALEIYGALKRICVRYHLSGVTIRCFDLLEPIQSTGCLALSILNSEGIYGGCEGDLPSLIAMMIIGRLTGQPVFMCNPSRILSKENQIIFAHCTLPITMPRAFHFMTHFESDLGVALAGQLEEGPCTIFKCSALLDRHFVSEGQLIENLCETHLCRTQIRLHLPEGTEYFTRNPIGNHHLIVLGHHRELLEEFFRYQN